MNLTCLFFSHDTAIDTSGERGVLRCKRCGTVTQSWALKRLTLQDKILVETEKLERERRLIDIRREREKRAREMSTGAKILRIQR